MRFVFLSFFISVFILISTPCLSVATPAAEKFATDYATYLKLPEHNREGFRLLAEMELEPYRLLREDMETLRQREEEGFLYHGQARSVYMQRGMGFNKALGALNKATNIDPSFAEAWAAQGELAWQVGALHKARTCLEAAMHITEERGAAGEEFSWVQRLEIYRHLGWVLRELGYYTEGLNHLERGLVLAPKDYELLLVKGLLLAGAGRTSEAISLAVALPPIDIQLFGLAMSGLAKKKSGFPTLWIKSQALGADGDWAAAWHILKDVQVTQRNLPYGGQFWSDVGMVAELAGRDDASLYYGISFINIRYRMFCPVMPNAMGSVILGIPNPQTPVYTGFGTRFYISGSRLSYAVLKMNQMTGGVFPGQREAAAKAALDALAIAERRHIRPVICQALRGRVYYVSERYAEAEIELTRARRQLAARGEIDEYASYLLGLLALQDDRHKEAQALLEEAVGQDPKVAAYWRSLGVALAAQDKTAEAEDALDQALALDANSVPGLFNLGLLYCKLERFDEAVSVLEKAYSMDAENREIQHLLHLAAGSSRLQGNALQSAQVVEAGGNEDLSGQYVDQVFQELAAVFAVPDSLEGSSDPNSNLSQARAVYQENTSRFNRKVLALALHDAGNGTEVQELLAPFWGDSLDPDEVVILLFVDQQLGSLERAQSLARAMLSGETGTDNPFIWVLALTSLSDEDDDGEEEAQEALTHIATNPGLGVGAASAANSNSYWNDFLQSGFANYRRAVHDESLPD